ncbi:MAG: sigma-70 family RNA polymerase sigma factor [Anaerolineae bacterium]
MTGEDAFLKRLQAGDPFAFAQFVEENQGQIYNLALRMLGDPQEAEDVLQETFLSAYKALPDFEGRSSLSTWLYRIASNACLMRLRKKRPDVVSVDEPLALEDGDNVPRQLVDWSQLPEDELLSNELRQEMDQAVSELPEALRVVFILRDLEGLSTAETAEVLELSEGAVKTRLHRARLWLRERLSAYFAERIH